ncbi:MAG: hypothetical protein N2749_00995 [Clostridia bacterium]|nr:hypothetical protein [Clostridia bacterium]
MLKPEGFEVFDCYRKTIEELPYMGDGKLAKSSSKQRAYIRGLLEKLCMNEEDLLSDTGMDIPISDFTVHEASEAIEYLLWLFNKR